MVTIRSTTAALLSLLAISAAPASQVATSSTATFTSTLSGVVRDDVGRVLEGVEVLVLAPTANSGGARCRAAVGGSRNVISMSCR